MIDFVMGSYVVLEIWKSEAVMNYDRLHEPPSCVYQHITLPGIWLSLDVWHFMNEQQLLLYIYFDMKRLMHAGDLLFSCHIAVPSSSGMLILNAKITVIILHTSAQNRFFSLYLVGIIQTILVQ